MLHVGPRRYDEQEISADLNVGPVLSGTIIAVVYAECVSRREKMACPFRLMASAEHCCPIVVGEVVELCSKSSVGIFFSEAHW